MRNILLAAGFLGLFGWLQACGGNGSHPTAFGDDGGTSQGGSKSPGGKAGSASKAGSSGMPTTIEAGAGGASEVGTLAPTVTITAPVPTTDPSSADVLSGDSVTVLCTVKASEVNGAMPVNASTVKVAILDAKGEVVEEKGAQPTNKPDEYSGDFNLTEVPAGAVGFSCSAESRSLDKGSDQIATLYDPGPTITFIKPIADAAQAVTQPLDLEFTVDAAPIAKGDDGATVDSVALSIVGVDIDLKGQMDTPGHYRLQVNLADPKLFMPRPTGATGIKVTATNQRKPQAVTTSKTISIAVDGDGPTITISNPLDKAFVRGKVTLTFDVGDAISGVDPSSVVVALNTDKHAYDASDPNWTFVKTTFSYTFESREVKSATVQLTVNISANDKVGNMAVPASELLYPDEYPPVMDLDPLPIRTVDDLDECSNAFDPVGSNATNDLAFATSSGFFRVLVVDETNRDPDNNILPHFSGTNPKSVQLYLQGDPSKPLLINNDDDPACDDVAQIDSTDSIGLDPIAKNGGPWYQQDDATAPTPGALGCVTKTQTAPDLLCEKQSNMWVVIQDEFNKIPVIYGRSVSPGTTECTGVGWQVTNKLTADGWVCLATRSTDNAGNIGISRPIRMCIDMPTVPGTPDCAVMSTTPPTCTDGCKPPPRLGNVDWLWK